MTRYLYELGKLMSSSLDIVCMTKLSPDSQAAERDRLAIEITEEMVAADIDATHGYSLGQNLRDLVVAVYVAMTTEHLHR